MAIMTYSGYEDASLVLRNPDLKQAMYDEGAVITEGVLLTLHGDAHRLRRNLEFRVFRRDFFHRYEAEVFAPTLRETLAPFIAAGGGDLLDIGFRVTMNLSADFAGIDRVARSAAETEVLLRLNRVFSEGATMVHSTRDKEELRAEVRAALVELDERFLRPSIARRTDLLEKFERGEISEDALPRDVLTVLLRNEDRLEMPPDLLRREIAFYLQAGSHSTGNSAAHAFHDIITWRDTHPQDRARMDDDMLFFQRCVHESMRLHPASPVAWRRPVCPVGLAGGRSASPEDLVIVDLHEANREQEIFGADAGVFNPHRALPGRHAPFGLTFGTGPHLCLGRDLDAGVVPRADTDPATHQYGIVTLLVRALLAHGARPDPGHPPVAASHTARPNWGSYPVRFGAREGVFT
jgi:cytochrome P450